MLSLLISFQGCSSEGVPDPTNQNIRVVTLNEVSANAYYQESSFSGKTQTESRAQLSFGVPGKVQKVLVDIGSQLKAGDVMATLDLEPYQLAVDNAQTEAEKAQITLDEHQANYERLNRLNSNNAVSQQDLEAARTLFLTAQASIHEAKSRVRLSKRELSQAIIKAPYDGVVSSRQVEPFEDVTQNQIIFSFDSSEQLIVESSLPVALANALRSTNERVITIRYQEKLFDAEVSHIAERASNGLSLPVKLRIKIPEGDFLPPGIVVAVNYRLKNSENVLVVPHGAVYVEATSNSAFLYSFNGESNTVNKRPVKIIDIQPTGYFIKAELKPGERYVAAGAAFISDGQQVRVVEETR
jgi:RND family efflux transporter MFP subunit